MEQITRRLGALEWPRIFEAPLVFAHDEDFDWVGGEVVLLALEEIVVPLEDRGVLVVLGCGGAEIDGADVAASSGVASDHHQQVLSGTGSFISGVRLEADVVAQRAALKDVVPGGDGERGHLDVLEVFFDGPLFPVVVVFSVGWPSRGNRARALE